MNIPSTMQALQMRGPGELALTTLPTPVPGPRDVLIRTLAATICTSNLHDLACNLFNIALPRVLGHEPDGVVVASGPEARDFATGTRMAVHPLVPCGDWELEIVGSCNDEDRLDTAMECLGDPSLAIHEIITHRIPFAHWPDAFTLARDGHDRALKIALTFPEAA